MSLQNATPLQIFEKIFSDNVIQLIIDETIRYATVQKNKHHFETSTTEIKIFLWFLILSGYYQLPSERDYWSENDDLGLSIVRSRNAYATLTRGSYDHRFEVNDEVLIVRWKDNKAVGIASNFDTILPKVSVQRWSSESKSRILNVQPFVI